MPEERKLVSILFADVTGSTELGDSLDPEDVRALMSRYYEHAQQIIPAHGGTLEKFIGDAVMAVFGIPRAHGDDAERAVAAAQALRAAVAQDEMLGAAFQLRIGINTGEVIATNDFTSGVFLATGDTVNVAARLQQHAQPGEIVVGERTRNASVHAFIYTSPRTVEVKGKRDPLQIYGLEGARPVRKVERPPMVGRKQDVMQLSLLQARTLEECRPQLVSIIAPAGTGKSRLLEEFLRRMDEEDGFQVATARCVPYGQSLSYWPLRGLLTELLGENISRAALEDIFRQYEQSPANIECHTKTILATLGMDGERAAERDNVLISWRLLIEFFAQQAPRIIVFEDLHWASDSLLDLVEYITQTRTHAPLMVITLSRPELLDRRPNWGGGKPNFTSLALQPLNAKQTREFVVRVMQGLVDEEREQIVERSGGNPFFALELIRGLRERGLHGQQIASKPLPDTVHAAVLARLDQLSQTERTVLQVASVASRAFSLKTLYDVLTDTRCTDIDMAIEGLIERDLIVPSGSTFVFQHILIRDVAYSTLSRAVRIHIHEQIAESLAQAQQERIEQYVELIAYHYREAIALNRQSAVRTPITINVERAMHFLRKAATAASRVAAYAEAHAYLQSALEIAPESESMSIYEQLGDDDLWSDLTFNNYQKALGYWEKTYQLKPHDNTMKLVGARLLRKLLIHYTRGGGHERLPEGAFDVQACYKRAEKLVMEVGNEYELWRLRVTPLFDGNNNDINAEERLLIGEAAVTYFEQREDWHALSEALDACIVIAFTQEAYPKALEMIERRLSLPDLQAFEYGDAFNMKTRLYMRTLRYMDTIDLVLQETQKLRGQSIVHILSSVACAMSAAFYTGEWDKLDVLKQCLDESLGKNSYNASISFMTLAGYFSALQVAMAREDQCAIETTVNVLKRFMTKMSRIQEPMGFIIDLYSGCIFDTDQRFVDCDGHGASIALNYYNERGLQAPSILRERVKAHLWTGNTAAEIAEIIDAHDSKLLRQKIDELGSQQNVVMQARLRVVLAEWTKDQAQLAQAKVELERLGDRQFLRRAQEVAQLTVMS